MPRRPNAPCAGGCGRLLWGGRGSLPAGERCCRECRAKGLAPKPVEQPLLRTDRRCDVEGCDERHLALGMCRRHYYRARWSAGLDGCTVPRLVLKARCHRWAASAPKVKSVICRHTVGIIPECPMCSDLMAALAGHHFICRSCWTEAEFNVEEVSWLATSAARSTRPSRRTLT